MDWKEFIEEAIKTNSNIEEITIEKSFLARALLLNFLTAEILDCVKKLAFYKNPKKLKENLQHLISEMESELEQLKMDAADIPALYEGEIEKPDVNTVVAHAIIGIVTEAGELSKNMIDALEVGEFDVINLKEEMFDIDWYKAIASDELGIDWNKGWNNCIRKLRARYGTQFSTEAANNRDLEKERKILSED